jgi:hypothetical protein
MRTLSETFPISIVPGKVGCSTISAWEGGTTLRRSQLLFVRPNRQAHSQVSLSLSPSSVVGGASSSGVVDVALPSHLHPDLPRTVQLRSTHPGVTVPLSVTAAPYAAIPGRLRGTFTISTATVGPPGTCAIITATLESSQDRALLKVGPIIAVSPS